MQNSNPNWRKLPLIFFIFSFVLLSSFLLNNGDLVKDILDYTNEFRKSNGKPRLVLKEDLNAIARRHSEDMASGRTGFGHEGFSERGEKIKKIYSSCTLAENVAYGASNGRSVVDNWKNSARHRRNMLGDYRYLG